jgi:hypothetical protein
MRTRTKLGMAIGAVALLGVAAAQPAKAAVVNGGFEGFPDFTGYTIIGNDTIQAADFRTPAEGNQQALIDTGLANVTGGPGNPVTAGQLETFLGLSAGSLTGLGATNGSAISQTITAGAGDTITFKYDLFTQEPTTAGRNDFGFVTLNGSVVTLATASGALLPPPAITGTGDNAGINSFAGVRETGYNMFTLTVGAAGTYTLGFGAVNVGDTNGQTGLLVDAITQVGGNGGGGGGVPLPAGMYLMPLGLALAGLYSVKLRRTAA